MNQSEALDLHLESKIESQLLRFDHRLTTMCRHIDGLSKRLDRLSREVFQNAVKEAVDTERTKTSHVTWQRDFYYKLFLLAASGLSALLVWVFTFHFLPLIQNG